MASEREQDGVLTDYEVYVLLCQQAAQRAEEERKKPLLGARRTCGTGSWRAQQDVRLISEQVLEYLADTGATNLNRVRIEAFLAAVKPFKLTQVETIVLLNMLPRSLVEIHLVVEECEERLTEDEREMLLDLCEELRKLAG
eukprot:CAMPEP_0183350144 /NCGR_PEP_ID=MMETSP0164_2-20130417/17027_1 /TAXON_ID=221442 /ORGANISM="Coccolithus pelagicus ssp braarudi, Strain PLY182g" /LENGTH=140 /DNA_ID=CAMNT_0025522019 /DNA_START=51 /DNA_END=473 /DNA_ORIENTATION=+